MFIIAPSKEIFNPSKTKFASTDEFLGLANLPAHPTRGFLEMTDFVLNLARDSKYPASANFAIANNSADYPKFIFISTNNKNYPASTISA